MFDKVLAEYNAKLERKDRQIKNYYEKIKRSKQEKLFYEVIVQIGNMDDIGVGSYSAEVATRIWKDYVELFQFRNPQLYVFGAYIHLDEEMPHLHLDLLPWVSGSERGLETRQALKRHLPAEDLLVGERKIRNGSSGQRLKRKILQALWSDMELVGIRRILTISIYPCWAIKSRSARKRLQHLRMSWKMCRLFLI